MDQRITQATDDFRRDKKEKIIICPRPEDARETGRIDAYWVFPCAIGSCRGCSYLDLPLVVSRAASYETLSYEHLTADHWSSGDDILQHTASNY
jgi:hypothetical protein